VFSWLTLAIIVGILGFMMNPGKWHSARTFLSGFANPLYIPQLYFRTPLVMMMGGAIILFLIPIILKKGNEVREKAISFVSMWLLIWAPVLVAGALLYRAAIPEAMMGNLPTALATMAFVKWYDSLLAVIFGAVIVSILIALWGFLKPKKLIGAALVIPVIAMFIFAGSFERVREFIRKPFVIADYMYANGLRAADYPLYKKNGILPYATYVETPYVSDSNRVEAGKNVFMIACSRCHTVTGVNSVVTKFRNLTPPGESLNADFIRQYIPKMDKVRYFMPPFPGNEAELDALVAFIMLMDKKPQYIYGAQDEGVKINDKGL
jgi:mono/diheme cytochrome c family protein